MTPEEVSTWIGAFDAVEYPEVKAPLADRLEAWAGAMTGGPHGRGAE
jgi:hypothetical protein